MSTRCLVLAVVGFAVGAAQGTPVQWQTGLGGNGHWYDFVESYFGTWDAARDAAAASVLEVSPGVFKTGALASITSSAENNWLVAHVYPPVPVGWNYAKVWLGGYQDPSDPGYSEPAGGWKWVAPAGESPEPWSYTNWYFGEPNGQPGEDYLEAFLHLGGAWNDIDIAGGVPNSWTIGWIVEWVPEPGAAVLLLVSGALLRSRIRA
jgi:hypothetical protein